MKRKDSNCVGILSDQRFYLQLLQTSVNILYCPSEDMRDFVNLQGELEPLPDRNEIE